MRRMLGAVFLVTSTGVLHADIFKCVTNGEVLFTSDRTEAKQKNCAQITVTPNVISPPPVSGKPAPVSRPTERPASSDGFPRVAPQVQQQRDGDRKKILETELLNEQKLLQDAKRELVEQENTRLGSERNAQRMLDRIEPYQKKVKLHEDNIANLQKELANLR